MKTNVNQLSQQLIAHYGLIKIIHSYLMITSTMKCSKLSFNQRKKFTNIKIGEFQPKRCISKQEKVTSRFSSILKNVQNSIHIRE